MELPYSEHFDDIYFAVEDGLAESRYVFLEKNNLPQGWQGRDRFTICETGFGTGLNFLCAWTLFEATAQPHQKLHYYSFEKFPLSAAEIQTYLAHWAGEFGGRLEKLVAEYPLRVGGWHTLQLSDRVTLTLMFDDMNRAIAELDTPIDCWFLDGHAPAKNPDMWSDNLFRHMGRLSTQGARFATFTAAGFVRRGLEAAGFAVTKDRGFGRKRDMSVGVFQGQGKIAAALKPFPQRIAIIGGGIAGASCSHRFAQRGAEVHLFEKTGLASGASGNKYGLFNPRFAKGQGFESDFYGSAFAQLLRQKHHKCGSLHMVTDEEKRSRLQGVLNSWNWHGDHMQWLSVADASDKAGVKLDKEALFLPDAGLISPAGLTTSLAQSAVVHIEDMTDLNRLSGYDVIVLASGPDITRFAQAAFLPLQAVRGQLSYMTAPPALQDLKSNLCYGGYCTPPVDGQMVVGSTFQHWLTETNLRDEDHRNVLGKLTDQLPFETGNLQVTGGRVSFRCAARDRVPMIGHLQDNIYVSTAHGSHGLLSGTLGAGLLEADIWGDSQILPRSVTARLSPLRFQQ